MKWPQPISLDMLNQSVPNTLAATLGIEYIEVGDVYLAAKMPVDSRTHQPAGLLHGGASVALAETIGSLGAYLILPPGQFDVVGLDINANHLRGIRTGYVIGKTWPVHVGRSTQVWQCEIRDADSHLISVARLTVINLFKEVH